MDKTAYLDEILVVLKVSGGDILHSVGNVGLSNSFCVHYSLVFPLS